MEEYDNDVINVPNGRSNIIYSYENENRNFFTFLKLLIVLLSICLLFIIDLMSDKW